MRDLVAGERVPVGDQLRLAPGMGVRPPLALALIALDPGRRASADFLPIETLSRELRPGARFEEDGALHLDLTAIAPTVDRLALVAFLVTGPGGGSILRDGGELSVATDTVRFRVTLNDRADTALILVEVYRYGGSWRLAAHGGGFVQGLVALADRFGVDPGWAGRLVGGAGGSLEGERHERGASSGSGVAVDRHHILSNSHVIEDARTIVVSGDGRSFTAEVVFADPRNDLALLHVREPMPACIPFRAGLDLHLGEEVVALGYPLQGLLGSGPQASAGNIAGLCGIGNDSSLFQFTAPIASGNSGGPILDGAGQMVGLVTSSLNLDRIRAAGNNAENVNFGIKGAVVRCFLDAFGLTPEISDPAPPIARAALVRQARTALHRVTCTC